MNSFMNDTSAEAQRDIQEQINMMRAELNGKFDEIVDIKQQNRFDDLKFYAIGFVSIFFLYVVVDNTLRTLRLYLKNRKREREEKLKQQAPDENEYEPSYSIDANVEKQMRKNIQRASENQNKALHAAKREKLASLNKEFSDRDIKEMPLDGNIDMQTIDKVHDEYQYNSRKSDVSFWDMVFTTNKEF